jgi:hypothetical protein
MNHAWRIAESAGLDVWWQGWPTALGGGLALLLLLLVVGALVARWRQPDRLAPAQRAAADNLDGQIRAMLI